MPFLLILFIIGLIVLVISVLLALLADPRPHGVGLAAFVGLVLVVIAAVGNLK